MGLQEEKIPVVPSIIWEHNSQPVNSMDLEIASFFALTEYLRLTHKKLKNCEYVLFAKTLWPITLVQNGPEDYIAVDGLNFYLFQFSLTLSPTTIHSKISRLLRDSGVYGSAGAASLEIFLKNLTETNNLILNIGKEDETIKGIIEPDVIRGLTPLIKFQDEQPTSKLAIIDSSFLTDQILDISGKFRNFINQIDGNINKWRELDELIVSITDQWLISLMKDIEDQNKRFDLEIRRKEIEAKGKIPDLQERKTKEFFDLSEWNLKERRTLAKSFVESMVPLISYFEEIKDRVIKIKQEEDPEEVSITLNKEISQLESRERLNEIINTVKSNLSNNSTDLQGLIETVKQKEREIEVKYQELESSVGNDLPALKERKETTMNQKNLMRSELENLTNTIRNAITNIISNCKNEQNYIKRWTIPGKEVNLVMPILKVYVPLYFAELENEEGEEKFIISPPVIIPRDYSLVNRWVPFEFVSSSFSPLIKERLETVLENNFELRSKFEFSCENKNLFQIEEMNNRILRGFDMLFRDKLMDEQHLNEIKKNWLKFKEKLNK
ncbi:MAG: hypothetical protein EAX96_04835 [Candidatus Lokiarchaeota archaeon]|nr:hypothetical protein [Candidatus Lokiarchaeota archaeon]